MAGTVLLLKTKVNMISPVRAATLVLLVSASSASAQLTPTPREHTLHDGRDEVRISRLDAHTLAWNGVEVGFDEHALLWLRPGTSLDEDALEISLVSTPSPTLNLHRVRGRLGEDGLDVALRLQGLRGVRGAIPDVRIPHTLQDIDVPPDDPRYPGQWFYDRIGIEAAWALEDGKEDVVVVVVDNGCDPDHPDLDLLPGRDVRDEDDDPRHEDDQPSNEHGTACAALVAADTDNGEGVAGTCPECSLRCVRLLGEGIGTPLSADVAAYEFVLEVDADVVSSSWGFSDPIAVPGPLREILETLADEGRGGLGTVVVFAAGNDNRNIGAAELQAVRGVISVGATNFFDETTAFSNFGDAVDLVAPTGTITADISGADGADPGDYTDLFGGTSSSAPIVSGVAALILSADPELSAAEVEALMRDTAAQSFFADPDDEGHDAYYGFGLVQPEAALRSLRGEVDAGPVDAGSSDGGVVAADAGVTTGTDDGCGCGAAGHPPTLGPLLLLALLWLRRK